MSFELWRRILNYIFIEPGKNTIKQGENYTKEVYRIKFAIMSIDRWLRDRFKIPIPVRQKSSIFRFKEIGVHNKLLRCE